MNKRSKIILVLSFVIVFAFSLSINIFADSAAYGDTELKPVFAPSSIKVHSNTYEAIELSGFSNVVVDVSGDSIDDTVYGNTVLQDYDFRDRAVRSYTLGYPEVDSDPLYLFTFGDQYRFYDWWESFELKYNDFYFDGSSLSLWDYYFTSISFDNGYSVSTYGLDCDVSYLNSSGELIESSLNFTGSTYRDVVDWLDYYLTTNYPNGVLVQNVVVYPVESSGRFGSITMTGSIVYTLDTIPLGSSAALLSWEDRFGGSVSSPTILESVTRGLNAIWDTSLFGLFTIGQVFSACAGVALFTWLLKIFNR